MEQWFNQYGLIEDKPQPQPVQDNGIVNRAEYVFLQGDRQQTSVHKSISHHLVDQESIFPKARYKKSPVNPETISHDNLTSIVALSCYYDFSHHKALDIWWHVKNKPSHLRLVPFYLACKYRAAYPLFLVAWFIELWSVLPTNYVNTDRGRVVDVDGERLAHIKLEGTRSRFRPLFYWILRKKWGRWRSWMTGEYFHEREDHINRELAEKKDDEVWRKLLNGKKY